jgi:hypothetical protein
MAVHGQGNRTVAGERLRRLGVDSASCQVADERMPQCVEIRNTPSLISVRNAGHRQVRPQQGTSPAGRDAEGRSVWKFRCQEWLKRFRKCWSQG